MGFGKLSDSSKSLLMEVARMAYGSRFYEGTGGGRGNMGVLVGSDGKVRVIKYDTHGRSGGAVASKDELTSANDLRLRLVALAQEAGLSKAVVAQIRKDLGLSEEGSGLQSQSLLSRKNVAKVVQKIGGDEAWRAALQNGDIARYSTRNQAKTAYADIANGPVSREAAWRGSGFGDIGGDRLSGIRRAEMERGLKAVDEDRISKLSQDDREQIGARRRTFVEQLGLRDQVKADILQQIKESHGKLVGSDWPDDQELSEMCQIDKTLDDVIGDKADDLSSDVTADDIKQGVSAKLKAKAQEEMRVRELVRWRYKADFQPTLDVLIFNQKDRERDALDVFGWNLDSIGEKRLQAVFDAFQKGIADGNLGFAVVRKAERLILECRTEDFAKSHPGQEQKLEDDMARADPLFEELRNKMVAAVRKKWSDLVEPYTPPFGTDSNIGSSQLSVDADGVLRAELKKELERLGNNLQPFTFDAVGKESAKDALLRRVRQAADRLEMMFSLLPFKTRNQADVRSRDGQMRKIESACEGIEIIRKLARNYDRFQKLFTAAPKVIWNEDLTSKSSAELKRIGNLERSCKKEPVKNEEEKFERYVRMKIDDLFVEMTGSTGHAFQNTIGTLKGQFESYLGQFVQAVGKIKEGENKSLLVDLFEALTVDGCVQARLSALQEVMLNIGNMRLTNVQFQNSYKDLRTALADVAQAFHQADSNAFSANRDTWLVQIRQNLCERTVGDEVVTYDWICENTKAIFNMLENELFVKDTEETRG